VPGRAKPVTMPELVIGRMDWSEPAAPADMVCGLASDVPGLPHTAMSTVVATCEREGQYGTGDVCTRV
jgi:hypothetical protein